MILLTGGHGLLGTHLRKFISCEAPTKNQLDITRPHDVNCDLIVHLAAYTDVDKAEFDKHECHRINVYGTRSIASLGKPVLYISTDSVFDGDRGNYSELDVPNPLNFYSLTKLLGEHEVLARGGKVIRTSFRERPWKFSGAYVDMYSSAQYVDEIAQKLAKVIHKYALCPHILHVGGPRMSHYDLAVITRPDINALMYEPTYAIRPRDTSLDTSMYEMFING